MKRLIIIIILFFPIVVFGNEPEISVDDKIEIEKMNVNIFYDKKSIGIQNTIDTKITYGNQPSTYFFDYIIPYEYETINKEEKINIYKASDSNLTIITDSEYSFSTEEKNLLIKFGNFYGVFQETEHIEISYNINFEKELEEESSVLLVKSNYDINDLEFRIFLDENTIDKNIKFGFNNKNFTSKLENLIIEKNMEKKYISGKYNGQLLKDNSLYFILYEEPTSVLENYSTIIYILIALIIVFLVYIVFRNKKKILCQ